MRLLKTAACLVFASALVTACSGDKGQGKGGKHPTAAPARVVEIVADGLSFEMPTEIPAGWTTFRFVNKSAMVHFALIEKMPPGIGMVEQQEQVAPVFQKGMDLLNADEVDAAMAEFARIPDWFAQIQFLGGPGFVAPGGIAETTLYLEPGPYLLECYVKTGGIFHSFNPSPLDYGMVAEFTVSPTQEMGRPPDPDMTVTISSEGGFQFEGKPQPGAQIVEVVFADQKTHENFVGHDVQLARLSANSDVATLVEWMDWRSKKGLETPAPVTFIGGTNEMPAGSSAYLHLTLEPGRYAWISETPGADEKGFLHIFEVAQSE